MAPRKPAPKKKPAAAGRAASGKALSKKTKGKAAAGKAPKKAGRSTPAGGAGKKATTRTSEAPRKKTSGAPKGAPKLTRGSTARPQKLALKRKVDVTVDKKKDRLQELRKALLKKKEAIVAEAKQEIAKYISGETRQLVDTAIDEGDWAVVDISEDINLRRLDAHRKTMRDIDEVLRKISEGTYGICEECGEEISEKRLKVIPTASLCITCQENKEQIEAIAREEAL